MNPRGMDYAGHQPFAPIATAWHGQVLIAQNLLAMVVSARGSGLGQVILRILPLVAVGLILSALVLGILLFVVGIPLPGRQPPGKEEPPTLSYTWIRPSDLPTTRVIINASELQDFPEVINGVKYQEDATIVLDQARYDALEHYLDGRCKQATGGPCVAVLSLQGQYYILLLL